MLQIKKGINNSLGDIVIDGKLISDKDYYVSGRVKITNMKVKDLYILDTGHITGNIEADRIFNYGKLEGEIIMNEFKNYSDNLIINKINDKKYLIKIKNHKIKNKITGNIKQPIK